MVEDVSASIAGCFPTTPISLNVAREANKEAAETAGPAENAAK
jgi:hypothetical protein